MAAGNALSEVFARFGVEFDPGPLVRGEGLTRDATSALQTLGQVVAGSALVVGLRNFNREMVTIGDNLNATATLLGVSTTELQEWHLAAELADVSAEEFDGALLRVQNRMAQGGSGAAVFRRLGVDIRDSNGELRNASDVLTDLADPIAALSTDAERTGVLVDLLGRSGARLAPLFTQGSEGIARARGELAELGGGAGADFIAAAAEQDDAIHRQDVAWLSLRTRLAVYVIPVFTVITLALTRLSVGLSHAADNSRLLQAAFVVLGVAGAAAGSRTAIAWVRAALPFVALAILLGGLILIVDDLWVGLEGGHSVLADLGTAFETWSMGVREGPLALLAGYLEYIKGILISTIGLVAELAGEPNPFGDIAGSVGSEGGPDAALAQQIIDQRQSADPGAAAVTPDSFERFQALQEAHARIAAGSAAADHGGEAARAFLAGRAGDARGAGPALVQHPVRIERIDVTGMTPTAAAAMVEGAVSRALARQTDDTVDSLT